MFIDTKYLDIYRMNGVYEYPPKLFLDFFYSKPNLKFDYKSSKCIHVMFGVFSFQLSIVLKWGFVERELNQREKHTKMERR